ncbi:MAG TPA: hypothetical protein VGM75_09800 [Pseudonocardiaceae bacterium]
MTKSHLNISPGEVHSSGSTLQSFGNSVAAGGDSLQSVSQKLVSAAGKDSSGVGSVLVKAVAKGADVAGKVFSEGGRVAGAAGDRLHSTATSLADTDQHHAGVFDRIHGGSTKAPRPRSGSTSTSGASPAGSRPSTPAGPPRPHGESGPGSAEHQPGGTPGGSITSVLNPQAGSGGSTTTMDHGLPSGNYQVSGPTVVHPNGISSTPVNSFNGYHGMGGEFQHYQGVLNGVQRPPGPGGLGNSNPNWQGWYLGESHEHGNGYAVSDQDGTGGAVAHYNFPNGATVHTIPEGLTQQGSDSPEVAAGKLSDLKQHFGVSEGESLTDGVGAQGGILRLPEENGHEVIVPWNLAPQGTATHHGFGDGMGGYTPGDTPPRKHPWTSSWNSR